MTDLPANVVGFLLRTTQAEHAPAFIRVDAQHNIADFGGELARYKLNQLTTHAPAEAALPWIIGLLPLPEPDFLLPTVQFAPEIYADVHLTRTGDDTLVLLLDASPAANLQQILQQKANELGILRDELAAQNTALDAERARSDQLLHTLLPPTIAQRIKAGETHIADNFDDVSVLFANVHGFTRLAGDLSPRELLARLNEIFSAFDTLAAERGLERIKTIGDGYMLVAGVPEPRPDHAEAVADLALAMLRAITELDRSTSASLSLRIGIACGPVVAGVIGTAKYAYDVWGKTVNLAAHLETSGLPGAIQVAASVFKRLQRTHLFERRGAFFLKGQGDLTTYLLRGKR